MIAIAGLGDDFFRRILSENIPAAEDLLCAADNASNRSWKSGLAAILPPESCDLLHHFPGRREAAFGADLLPEVEVEAAVVLGMVAEDPRHEHSFRVFQFYPKAARI